MRDVDRLREKIEVSLDDKQIAVLAVCALLLLGGVFSLGLLVGKRLTAAAPQPAPANDLLALDELQKGGPPRTAETQQPRAIPGKAQTVAGKPPALADRPPVAAENPPTLAARPPAASGKPPASDPKPPPAAKTVDDLDRDPDEQPVPEERKPPPAQTAMVPTPREPVLIDPPPKPRAVEPAKVPFVLSAPPRNLGHFTVQIGASQDHADAQKLESRARLAGLKPYVVEARLGNRGTWYRVRVGAFNDKDAANNFRRDVERELRVTAMVMPSR